MRKPYLAGNWKMNLGREDALGLCGAIREHVGDRTDVEVAVAPAFVYVPDVVKAFEGSPSDPDVLWQLGAAPDPAAEPDG